MTTASPTLDVLHDARSAAAVLHPLRRRILGALGEAASATEVAARLGLPRQKVNYHVRKLEEFGLVEEVERRRKGNCTERLVRATARRYLISPAVLGEVGATPDRLPDRFSSACSVAVAGRTLREVATLRERAAEAGRKLPTLTLDAEIRFAGPAAQVAFANELVEVFADLVARHHAPDAPEGRTFRLVFQGHPAPAPTPPAAGSASGSVPASAAASAAGETGS